MEKHNISTVLINNMYSHSVLCVCLRKNELLISLTRRKLWQGKEMSTIPWENNLPLSKNTDDHT